MSAMLPPNVLDLAEHIKTDEQKRLEAKAQIVLSACAQKPDGQFTILRADSNGYLLLAPESVEIVAHRVVEILNENARARRGKK